MQKAKRVVLVLTGIALIATMIRMSNPSQDNNMNHMSSTSNVEVSSPTASQTPPGQQKFDVRLSGANSTTLEEYYYGKAVGNKAVITFNGGDKSGGKVEVMYEWNMQTGKGTWKAEHHPTKGFGQRKAGSLEVINDEATASFAVTLFDEQGKEWDKGQIIPL